jgi:gliding motility-associated-like protein
MQVLNRWGQLVFETNRTDGRGWDGKFNNQDQPEGVYIYLIAVEVESAPPEKYQGNVTLIR